MIGYFDPTNFYSDVLHRLQTHALRGGWCAATRSHRKLQLRLDLRASAGHDDFA